MLRFGMPGPEVDAMIAAGPAVTHYNPDTVPVLRLLRSLAAAGRAGADGGQAGVPAVAAE